MSTLLREVSSSISSILDGKKILAFRTGKLQSLVTGIQQADATIPLGSMYIWRLLNLQDFWTPPSPCQYQIHATSLPLVRIWLTPSLPLSADVICTSSLTGLKVLQLARRVMGGWGNYQSLPPPAAPFKSMRYWPHGGDDHDVFMAGSRGEELERERSIQSQGRIDSTFIWKSSPKSADIKSNNAIKSYDVLSKVPSKRR